MHRATSPARATRRPTKQLRHQVSRRHSLRQRMPVSAMRAEDRIVIRQMSTHAGRDRLLPDLGMAGSEDQPTLVTAGQFLLRVPDDEHRAKE